MNLINNEKWHSAYYYINLAALFLLSLHIGGYVGRKVIVWATLMLVCAVLFNKRLELDRMFWVLAAAMILYGLIFQSFPRYQTEYWKIRFSFVGVVGPSLSMYLVCQQAAWKQKQERIELLLLSICLGTFIYSVLNHWIYMQEGFTGDGRMWNEFWTHGRHVATEFSYWGVFIVGLVGYGLFCLMEKNWLHGGAVCILIIIENIIHIIVDNRMVIMVTAVAAAISVLLYLYFNRKDKKKVLLLFLGIFFIVAVVLFIIAANVGDIRNSTYYTHFITRDGGIIRNVRFQMIWEALLLLPSHWRGGGTMVVAGFEVVHNYWLQVANDTGIFPFAIWMVFNVAFVVSLVKCVRNPAISMRIKYMIVPLAGAVISYLSMEQGGHGQGEYILFYVMLAAIIRQLEKNEKRKRVEEDDGI